MGYDDYDPWGLTLAGRSLNISGSQEIMRNKFTGKELDDDFGLDWYYFGARYYDAEIGRFFSVDRFVEKYPSMTSYQYAANNPILFIDINGDSLRVTGDTTNDIKDLVGSDNLEYVQIDEIGNVTLLEGFQVIEGGGSELFSNLVKSDKSYTYSVGNVVTYKTRTGRELTINLQKTSGHPIISAVKGGRQNPIIGSNQPISGDAHLTMTGTFQYEFQGNLVPRTNIVYHELSELYIMTETGLPRYTADQKSAHVLSGLAGVQRVKINKINAIGANGIVTRLLRR